MSNGVAGQVLLPRGTAAWVLTAHAFTLASPVVLAAVAWAHYPAVEREFARPGWVIPAAMLLLAGSVAEAAQNTVDRWVYRGPYPALADAVFVHCITAGTAALAVAALPGPVVLVAALAAMVMAPLLYRSGNPGFAAMGAAGALGAVAVAVATGQPVALLLLVTNGMGNAVLLDLVVRTGAQSLHGAIAFANGLGTVALAVAVAGTGRPPSPPAVAVTIVGVLVVVALVVARPRLARLAATPAPRPLPVS